jgi:hypothetical protein
MVEETPSASDRLKGRIAVAVIIGSILFGTFGWVAWDQLGATGLDPAQVKELATVYEAECVKERQDRRACKQFVGHHHRACLKDGVVRVNGAPPTYDQAAYSACMRAAK